MGCFWSYGYIAFERKAALLAVPPVKPPPPGPYNIPKAAPIEVKPPSSDPNRKRKPPFRVPDDHPGFLDHGIQVVLMKETGIEHVDKKLKELGERVNAHVRRWFDLDMLYQQMRFVPPKAALTEHYQHVMDSLGGSEGSGDTLSVKYVSEYGLEILYDKLNLTTVAIQPVLIFNHSMKLIDDILSHHQPIRQALELLFEEEQSLWQEFQDGRSEDLSHSLIDNLRQLHQAVTTLDVIHEEAVNFFNLFKTGVSSIPMWVGCDNDPTINPDDFFDRLEGTIARTGHPTNSGPRYIKLKKHQSNTATA